VEHTIRATPPSRLMLAGIRSEHKRDSNVEDGQRTKSHDGGSTSLLGDLCLFNIHDIHDNTIGSASFRSHHPMANSIIAIQELDSPSLEHLCQTSLDTESTSSTTACSGSIGPVHDVWSGRSVRVAVGGGRQGVGGRDDCGVL